MTKTRKKFTAEQKAEIVRHHLKDKTPISNFAEELVIQPTQIYQWVTVALEQLDKLFAKQENGKHSSSKVAQKMADLKDQQIKRLQAKLVNKNEVIAELMEENGKAKKANGDLWRSPGFPTMFMTRSSAISKTGWERKFSWLIAMHKLNCGERF